MTDWKTKEISLVKRGANKKRPFPIFKQETLMDPEMIEILKALMDEEIEDEAKLTEWIEKQKLSDKEAAAVKGAMRILNAFSDNATVKKVMDSMAKMVGFPGAEPKKPDEKPLAKKADDIKDPKKEEPVKKDDAIPEAVQKQLDDANERAEKIEKANEELRKEVEEETHKRERTELVSKCKELYLHVPGLSTDEQADLLLDTDDAGRKQIEKQWAATETAIVKSGLLATGGTGGADASGGDAGRKLEEIARGIVEKSSDGLTYEQAYTRAMDANPEIYTQYLDENNAQTGRKG